MGRGVAAVENSPDCALFSAENRLSKVLYFYHAKKKFDLPCEKRAPD